MITHVIKLGGAAITDKSKFEVPQLDVITTTAAHLAASCMSTCSSAQPSIIIVHGAGSFGHFTANAHKVAQGWSEAGADVDSVRRGWALTRQVRGSQHSVAQCACLDW